MSRHIEQLSFTNFRNYPRLSLKGFSGLTVFSGENAVGKTNIIEGIQLLTSGSSFRHPKWNELIHWDTTEAMLEALLRDEKRETKTKLLIKDNRRNYEVNEKKKTPMYIKGLFPTVLFIPDHLRMVKASSVTRRDAIDEIGSQLSKTYIALRTDYLQVLKQRNLLIKDGIYSDPLLHSWNESLVTNGSRLCFNRIRLFKRLIKHMERIYSTLVPTERFQAVYVPSWQRLSDSHKDRITEIAAFDDPDQEEEGIGRIEERLEEAIKRYRRDEEQRRTSLIGPHKDEVIFFLNGRNARLFASQGQQRTIVLAWKLAELELIREILEIDPLLLLDDVMSELDEAHREALTDFISHTAQTFITTTNLGYFSNSLLKKANIIELPLSDKEEVYG